MTAPSRIAKRMYWDAALRLVSGCHEVDASCNNCWARAETNVRRHQRHPAIRRQYGGVTDNAGRWTGDIITLPENLAKPARRRIPTVYAVWNDLFHEKVPLEFIVDAICEMSRLPHHTFLICTKRIWRAHEIINELAMPANVALGVSIPSNQYAWRAQILAGTNVSMRYISWEPALTPIPDVYPWLDKPGTDNAIHAVIAGGETGPDPRPAHPLWFDAMAERCSRQYGTAFFLKHRGCWIPCVSQYGPGTRSIVGRYHNDPNDKSIIDQWLPMIRTTKDKAGHRIDGREYNHLLW